jgi:hypothetical protein
MHLDSLSRSSEPIETPWCSGSRALNESAGTTIPWPALRADTATRTLVNAFYIQIIVQQAM